MSDNRLRRVAMFVVGVAILVLELEWQNSTRWAVVALALALMGEVTVEQVLDWVHPKGK